MLFDLTSLIKQQNSKAIPWQLLENVHHTHLLWGQCGHSSIARPISPSGPDVNDLYV